MRNPFTTEETTDISVPPEYATSQRAYTVPGLEKGDAYTDEFGWSPRSMRLSAAETPSAQRLGGIPRAERMPDPAQPPGRWWDRLTRDISRRHSVEKIDADGWTEQKGVTAGEKRWRDNPRLTPVAESRPTQQMAPITYSFERPFGQEFARTLTGNHFSMADHRREYEILGMQPTRQLRNTYRIEPQPWDMDIVDLPPTVQYPNDRHRNVEVPSTQRSWRLG